jgi:hypothetical protein
MINHKQMTGKELGEQLWQLIRRFPDQFNGDDERLIGEAERRLRAHDGLVADVLPDLRNRITALEERTDGNA